MTEARPDPRVERTRRALIAAGRRLFCQYAIDAVTVDDIVREAKVGKGSFYNHFADREALAREVAAEIRARIERAVDCANASVEDPARRIARAVCTYFRFVLDEPERAGFLVRVYSGHTFLAAQLNRNLVDDLSNGLEVGRVAIPTLEAGALYVLGIVQVTMARLVQEQAPSIAVSLAQQMCGLALRGLGLPNAEADLVAAQASEEIVRKGKFASAFQDPDKYAPRSPARRHRSKIS